MSHGKVHSKTVVKDAPLRELKRQVALMKNSWVTVGVHEDAGTYEAEPGKAPVPVSKVAFWLEQGTQHMPARPFFYPALAGNQDTLKRMFAAAAAQVTTDSLKTETALGRIGFAAQTWVQNVIKSNVAPALSAPYAARRKEQYPEQGTRTLIRSGLLLRSVRYKLVLDGHEPVVGPSSEPDSAESPSHDKHGNHTGRAPQRSEAARRLFRESADAFKAQQRAQRAAAKANPEAHKQAFDAQRRSYTTHTPKGSG